MSTQEAPADSALPGHITHIRCVNPGPMTLTGTNTYVVAGTAEITVIDPGPVDAPGAHEDAVFSAATHAAERLTPSNATPVRIVLTHHHSDHSGAVERFVERFRAGGHPVTTHGGGHPWPGVGQGPSGLDGLDVIATPGHTADSVCLFTDGPEPVLFSGDSILGGSSSFIAHPDGNLTDYLASLEILRERVSGRRVLLAPGHGLVGGDAAQAVSAYVEHRQERLAEVRAALHQVGEGATVEQVADVVYADVGASLRPAVEAIVSAQLEHLRRVG